MYGFCFRFSASTDKRKTRCDKIILGTDAWEKELYSDLGQPDIFGDAPFQRAEDVKSLERYVKRRLEAIFPKVFDAKALPIDHGPQRFSLFLCISNSAP